MLTRAGGADNIKTVVQTNGDGSTTTLRTHAGNPEFVTTKPPAPEVEEPYFVFSHLEYYNYPGTTDYSLVSYGGVRLYTASKPTRKFRKAKKMKTGDFDRYTSNGHTSVTPARVVSANGRGKWVGYICPFDLDGEATPNNKAVELVRVTGSKQSIREEYRHAVPAEDRVPIYPFRIPEGMYAPAPGVLVGLDVKIHPTSVEFIGHTTGGAGRRDYLLAAYSDGDAIPEANDVQVSMRYEPGFGYLFTTPYDGTKFNRRRKYRFLRVERDASGWTKVTKSLPFDSAKSYTYLASSILAPGAVAMLFSVTDIWAQYELFGTGLLPLGDPLAVPSPAAGIIVDSSLSTPSEPSNPVHYSGCVLLVTTDYGDTWASIDASPLISDRSTSGQVPAGFTMGPIKEDKVLVSCTSGYMTTAPSTYTVSYSAIDFGTGSTSRLGTTTWDVGANLWKAYIVVPLGPIAWLEILGSYSTATEPVIRGTSFGQSGLMPMPQTVISARYTLDEGATWTAVTLPSGLMGIVVLVPFNSGLSTPPQVAFTLMKSHFIGTSDQLVCEAEVKTTSDFVTYKAGNGSIEEIVNGIVFDIVDVGSSKSPAPINSAAPWAHDSKYPSPSDWTAP